MLSNEFFIYDFQAKPSLPFKEARVSYFAINYLVGAIGHSNHFNNDCVSDM